MRTRQISQACSCGIAAIALLGVARAAPGDNELVSVRIPGQTTAGGFDSVMSSDGRFVAFESASAQLVPNDTNHANDVFVFDRQTSAIERVSLNSGARGMAAGGSRPAISADGRFVAFRGGFHDILVRDRQLGTIESVCVNSRGNPASDSCDFPAISADGRYVAFVTRAALVSPDTNGLQDVFVHDRQTGVTERVSNSSSGQVGNAQSSDTSAPAISADGRYVAFESGASNFVPNDTNNLYDLYVHDRQSGTTRLVTAATNGVAAGGIGPLSMSADGRYIAFYDGDVHLLPGDTNGVTDAFVRDMQTGAIERVSVSSSGEPENSDSGPPTISADGRFVGFASAASNLVAGDTNGQTDVFLHDRQTGLTERGSLKSNGVQGNGGSTGWLTGPHLSADGRYIAFNSDASNFAPGDFNGSGDIFVRDRQSSTLTLVTKIRLPSEAAGGITSPGGTAPPNYSITPDGRYVAFASIAADLIAADRNYAFDVFVYDRQSGATERVSVSSSGEEGDGESINPSISADGRYVAFESEASNLAPGSVENGHDILVHDRQSGVTELVSAYIGSSGINVSVAPSISADGRYVAFSSPSPFVVPEDNNRFSDIFVADRKTHLIKRVNLSPTGKDAKGGNSSFPIITPDARYVGYLSQATNLVPGDLNKRADVFVLDRQTGVTERVNLSSSGEPAHNDTRRFTISDDGRFVAFQTVANNMVPGDSNRASDIFVRDRQTHTTRRVSVSSNGEQGNFDSEYPSISRDGRYVAFQSLATNLVPGIDPRFDRNVFVHDSLTGRTERINMTASGEPADGISDRPKITGDGRLVIFRTSATNLSDVDLDEDFDLYAHERALPQ